MGNRFGGAKKRRENIEAVAREKEQGRMFYELTTMKLYNVVAMLLLLTTCIFHIRAFVPDEVHYSTHSPSRSPRKLFHPFVFRAHTCTHTLTRKCTNKTIRTDHALSKYRRVPSR